MDNPLALLRGLGLCQPNSVNIPATEHSSDQNPAREEEYDCRITLTHGTLGIDFCSVDQTTCMVDDCAPTSKTDVRSLISRGDHLVAINGVRLEGKSFTDSMLKLTEACARAPVILRFKTNGGVFLDAQLSRQISPSGVGLPAVDTTVMMDYCLRRMERKGHLQAKAWEKWHEQLTDTKQQGAARLLLHFWKYYNIFKAWKAWCRDGTDGITGLLGAPLAPLFASSSESSSCELPAQELEKLVVEVEEMERIFSRGMERSMRQIWRRRLRSAFVSWKTASTAWGQLLQDRQTAKNALVKVHMELTQSQRKLGFSRWRMLDQLKEHIQRRLMLLRKVLDTQRSRSERKQLWISWRVWTMGLFVAHAVMRTKLHDNLESKQQQLELVKRAEAAQAQAVEEAVKDALDAERDLFSEAQARWEERHKATMEQAVAAAVAEAVQATLAEAKVQQQNALMEADDAHQMQYKGMQRRQAEMEQQLEELQRANDNTKAMLTLELQQQTQCHVEQVEKQATAQQVAIASLKTKATAEAVRRAQATSWATWRLVVSAARALQAEWHRGRYVHKATTAELLVTRTLAVRTKYMWHRAVVQWAWRLWKKQVLGEFCSTQKQNNVEHAHDAERRQLVICSGMRLLACTAKQWQCQLRRKAINIWKQFLADYAEAEREARRHRERQQQQREAHLIHLQQQRQVLAASLSAQQHRFHAAKLRHMCRSFHTWRMFLAADKFGDALRHLQSQHATATAGLRQRQRAALQAQQEQQLEDLEQQREQHLQQEEEQGTESGVVVAARNEALLHTARAVRRLLLMRTSAATFLFSRRIRVVMALGSGENGTSGDVNQQEIDASKWVMFRGWVSWAVAVSDAGFESMLRASLRKEWEQAQVDQDRTLQQIEQKRYQGMIKAGKRLEDHMKKGLGKALQEMASGCVDGNGAKQVRLRSCLGLAIGTKLGTEMVQKALWSCD